MSLATVLAIVFVVLKLTDVIAWSWWWVLSPLWIELGIVLFVVVTMAIGKKTGGDMPPEEPAWSWDKRGGGAIKGYEQNHEGDDQ